MVSSVRHVGNAISFAIQVIVVMMEARGDGCVDNSGDNVDESPMGHIGFTTHPFTAVPRRAP